MNVIDVDGKILADSCWRAKRRSHAGSLAAYWVTSSGKIALTDCSIRLIHVLLHVPHTALALVSMDLPRRE